MRFALALVFAAALLGACSSGEDSSMIQGTITWRGKGIPSALIEVYENREQVRVVSPVAEAVSADDGSFALRLPKGTYWIDARAMANSEGKDIRLVSGDEHASLAVATGKDVTELEIPLTEQGRGGNSTLGEPGTGVRGTVAGAPSRGTTLYAYRGHTTRPVGPSFAASVRPDESGAFLVNLPPGNYTIAARWRATGDDFYYLAPNDKVAERQIEVVQGEYFVIDEMLLRPVDAETLSNVLKVATSGAASVVEGTVVGPGGAPEQGLYVLAFRDSRMAGKPVAVSRATGVDGKFSLGLEEQGTYFLGARTRLGGPAEPGEKVGVYRGEDGGGLQIDGKTAAGGIKIEVEEIW